MKKLVSLLITALLILALVGCAYTANIGEDAAKAIALSDAGVLPDDATFTKVELDTDDGRREYELEFHSGTDKYDYHIDAATGKIIGAVSATESTPAMTAEELGIAAMDIGEDAAKQIALDHAGVAEANAAFTKVKLDTDDGRREYDIEFTVGDTEYDYDIDAVTGEIVKFGSTTVSVPAPVDNSSSADIGKDAAKQAALDHAGIAEADATRIKVQPDKEDGRRIYEVEFVSGDIEYDYDIDAATGEVLKNHTESIYD